jgi:hypothetical protein
MSDDAYLLEAIIDRERRLLNLASIIRRLVKDGAQIPTDVTVDYSITPEEARALGVKNWQAAIEPRRTSG